MNEELKYSRLFSVLPKLERTKPQQIGFFARGKRLQSSPILYQVIIRPISQIWVLFSGNIIKITQLGRKQLDCWLPHEVDNSYWWLSRTDYPWNWWKRMFLDIEKAQKHSELTGNWQIWGELPRADGLKSSPIFSQLPNSFLIRGRRFQSSPMRRVNHGIGNTGWDVSFRVVTSLSEMPLFLLKKEFLFFSHKIRKFPFFFQNF